MIPPAGARAGSFLRPCAAAALLLALTAPALPRDPLRQPFASTSIWNMPIGSGAVYVPANLPPVPGNEPWAPMPQADEEVIVMRPAAALTPVYASTAGWTGRDRCGSGSGSGSGSQLLMRAPLPDDFVVPHSRKNNSAAVLAADGRTVLQMQPFTRCAGQAPTGLVAFPPVDLYGDGRRGSHGGSGLSALGGSLRLGELRPGTDSPGPRHALKINVYAKQVLYPCQRKDECYVWPAYGADSYAVGHYGSGNRMPIPALRMGALLAIPASQNLNQLGLETAPARQLAWTLQNFGAYIVDDTWGPGFALNVERGPDGSFLKQFHHDWGFPFEQRARDNTPWVRDLQRLVQALQVVANNGPDSVGGGGTPLQPLAAPLSGPD